MLKLLDKYLIKISPALHKYFKRKLNEYRKSHNPKLSREEFIDILKNDLTVSIGDVLFIHSSMRKLFLDFPKEDILPILMNIVGENGTLLFPCWQFNIRAEDYIKGNEIVFSFHDSPSAMGRLSDVLRQHPEAFRSFHPTNSIVAIGKRAKELTEGHADDVYPCGEKSPLFKMIKYDAKVIGIGVTVDNLTFVHVIEDTIKEKFPVKTRDNTIHSCNCIDETGNAVVVKTLVASKAVSKRDVTAFFNNEIPQNVCKRITRKGMSFFSGKTPELYQYILKSAEKGKTIYL